MYEELIKRLRSESTLPYGTIKDMREAADVIEEEDMAFRHLERDYKELCAHLSKWVPVTEKLPEIDEKHHCSKDVLVYLDGGYMAFSALEENIFGQTWFDCERYPNVEEEMKVTHWMSLPEPPKEKI